MAPDEERVFDKRGADALLPRLRALLGRLQEEALSEAADAGRQHLADAGRSNGSAEAAAAALETGARMQSVLDEIAGLGVILRDLDTGLCDFPAQRYGEPVYLCWRLDEDEVAWWHPRDTGAAGRQPL